MHLAKHACTPVDIRPRPERERERSLSSFCLCTFCLLFPLTHTISASCHLVLVNQLTLHGPKAD